MSSNVLRIYSIFLLIFIKIWLFIKIWHIWDQIPDMPSSYHKDSFFSTVSLLKIMETIVQSIVIAGRIPIRIRLAVLVF